MFYVLLKVCVKMLVVSQRTYKKKTRKQNKWACFFTPICMFIVGVSLFALMTFLVPYLLTRSNISTEIMEGLQVSQTQTLYLGSNEMLNAGDAIQIKTQLVNTGIHPIYNVTLSDSVPIDTICQPGGVGPEFSIILPNEIIMCFGIHTITQQDINNAEFQIETTVEGVSNMTQLVYNVNSTTNLTQTTFSSLTVSQMYELDLGPDEMLTAGDTLVVTGKVINTGTETLVNVSFYNETFTELIPAQMQFLYFNYTILQADILAERVDFNFTASGIGLTSQDLIEATSFLEANLTQITLGRIRAAVLSQMWMKLRPQDECPFSGDFIIFEFIVENTGTETLSNVQVSDSLTGTTGFVCQPMGMDNSIGTMFPGDMYTCSGAYTLQMSDIPFGENFTIAQTITATGTGVTKLLAYTDVSPSTSLELPGVYVIWARRVGTSSFYDTSFSSATVTGSPLQPGDFEISNRQWAECALTFHYLSQLSSNPRSFVLSNFNIHPRHVRGRLRIGGIVNRNPLTFTTDPPNLFNSWILEPVISTNMQWNPSTGVISIPNTGNSNYGDLYLGDLRQYTSITVSASIGESGDTYLYALGEEIELE